MVLDFINDNEMLNYKYESITVVLAASSSSDVIVNWERAALTSDALTMLSKDSSSFSV